MVFRSIKAGFQKIKTALSKTRSALGKKLHSLLHGTINEETLDKIEQALFEADLGREIVERLTKKIHSLYTQNPHYLADDYLKALKEDLKKMLSDKASPQNSDLKSPHVILIVGVNGNGKTTTIAKLAHQFKAEGKSVLIGAADTFRAAAIDQLEVWAKRIDVEIVKGAPQSDPSAVVFDTLSAAIARGKDVVLIDTAGRLHTKQPLMQELEKIRRTSGKVVEGAPHDTYLIIDATTGQNGLDQASTFQKYTPLSGLIVTKLDGTAKGGILVNLHQKLNIPVKYVGIGEGIDDLEPFDVDTFVNALFD